MKNVSKLEVEKKEDLQIKLESNEMEKVEEILVKEYEKENPSNLNELIFPLMETLSIEKQEGEKNTIFEQRLLSATNKILNTHHLLHYSCYNAYKVVYCGILKKETVKQISL